MTEWKSSTLLILSFTFYSFILLQKNIQKYKEEISHFVRNDSVGNNEIASSQRSLRLLTQRKGVRNDYVFGVLDNSVEQIRDPETISG